MGIGALLRLEARRGLAEKAMNAATPARAASWVYAGGVFLSLGLGAWCVWMRSHASVPTIAGWNAVDVALSGMVVTLLFGLGVVFPMLHRTHEEREELESKAAKLEVEAFTDPLTGLYNRRYFEQALTEYLAAFSRAGAPLGLLTLDIDHFKSVNDNYGHDAGDVVLRELAQLLKGLTREHDIVARTGGEEFAILAPFATIEQVRPFAERLCRMVANMRIDVNRVVLRPTVSIGLATTLDGAGDAEALIKMSDERLYKAKQGGRNRVCAGDLEVA